MLPQPCESRRRERRVTIITDEPPCDLAPLCAALEQRGIQSGVAPAWSGAQAGASYIRSIDRRLDDASGFARIAALGAHPALVVNTPACVRVAEWLPLATHALRDRDVPQPRRLWCFDHDDLAGAAETLGTHLIVEGVVSRRRLRASSHATLCEAFDHVVEGHAQRGALVEAPLRGATAELSLLIVDAERIPLPGRRDRCLPTSARRRAAQVAARAVSALGASVMTVDVAVNQMGEAQVLRVDAAPRLHRLDERALEAIVHAITRRVRAASLLTPTLASGGSAGDRLRVAAGAGR